MNNTSMGKLQARLGHHTRVNSLLMASLGLIFFTIVSTGSVYAETISVDIGGTSYDIEYTATGMTVSGVQADTDFASLIFTVDVTESPGTLDITFERSFFDSVSQGEDDDFFVLVDGNEPNSTETKTAQSRTLSIDLPAGTDEVEIIGSVFGTTAPVEDPVEEPVEEPREEPEEPREEPEEPVEESREEPEEPVEEPREEPKEDPEIQCDPGQILVDGVCELDDRCGPGTIFVDGVCELDKSIQPTSGGTQTVTGMGKELVIAVVAAFVIAGIVGLILGIMSKASKSSD